MGLIRVTVTLLGKRRVRTRALVDTGATFTVIPAALAGRLGLRSLRSYTVRIAGGEAKRFRASTVGIQFDGREAPATVLIAPAGEVLLGAETLEILGLKVNPRKGRLEKMHPFAIMAASYAGRR